MKQSTQFAINTLRYFGNIFDVYSGNRYEYPFQAFNRIMLNLERFIMPAKHQRNTKKLKFGDTWFASDRLETDELIKADQWISENAADLSQYLEHSVATGHSVKITWDDYNDCFTASLTCLVGESANFGGILTARDDTAIGALELLMYKHHHYYGESAWPRVADRPKRG